MSLVKELRAASKLFKPEAHAAADRIEQLEKQLDDLLADIENKADIATLALRKAWQLGQTYWQQADSESMSQWKKADATQAKFQQLVEETHAAITRVKDAA